MTINAGEFLIAFVAAMGIPSAIMGFIVWKLERKIAARDKRAEEQDGNQDEQDGHSIAPYSVRIGPVSPHGLPRRLIRVQNVPQGGRLHRGNRGNADSDQ